MKNKKVKKEASVVADIKGYLAGSKEKAIRRSKKLPWYLNKANEIKHALKEELGFLFEDEEDSERLRFSGKKKKLSWREKAVAKFKDLKSQIKNLEVQVKKGRESGSLDLEPEQKLAALKRQKQTLINAVKKGGKDWEKYLIDPKGAEKIAIKDKDREAQKEKKQERSGSNEEIINAINNYKKYQIKQNPGTYDEKVKGSIDSILDKYAGHAPTTSDEFSKISQWVEKKFWPASGFDIPAYIKKKSSNWQNLKFKDLAPELKTQVASAFQNLGAKTEPSAAWQKWEQLPKDLQANISAWYDDNADKVKASFKSVSKTTPSPKMKAKQRKSGTKISPFDSKEISGGTKSAPELAKKLNKQHPKDKPHSPPKYDASGKMLYPGTAMADLSNTYEKIGDQIIYGEKGMFDDILDEIQKRNQNFDVRDLLKRYLEIEDKLDPQSDNIEPLKKAFSKDELKLLADIAEKTDPENLSDVPEKGYSEFEKVVAPIARKHYQAKGHALRDEEEDDDYAASGANTKELKLVWSQMLKSPIDDVDEKLTNLKKKDPDSFKELEDRAIAMLKASFPGAYEKEMSARKDKADLEDGQTSHQISNKALDNLLSALKNPNHANDVIKAFKKAVDDKDKLQKIAQNVNNPVEIMKIISQKSDSSKDSESTYEKNISSFDKLEKDRHSTSKGSKEQRRAAQRNVEPRDLSPEEIEHRKKMGKAAAFHSMVQRHKQGPKKPNDAKVRSILNKNDGEKKMASNESKKFSLKRVLESFDNSYELDSEYDEESWESKEPAEKKDWMKDLSLKDLFGKKSKKKSKKKDDGKSTAVVSLDDLEDARDKK